jgi:hypothetical protein
MSTRPAPPPASHGPSNGAIPTVQREGDSSRSAAGTGAAGTRAHSDRELEELAQALFSRIRSRLRSDLIHDREAKGLTFDNV